MFPLMLGDEFSANTVVGNYVWYYIAKLHFLSAYINFQSGKANTCGIVKEITSPQKCFVYI